jgi:hypothetical protein
VNSRLEILQKRGGDAAAHVTAHHVAAMYPVLPLFHDWPAFELSRHSQRFRWLSGTSNWETDPGTAKLLSECSQIHSWNDMREWGAALNKGAHYFKVFVGSRPWIESQKLIILLSNTYFPAQRFLFQRCCVLCEPKCQRPKGVLCDES